IMLEQSDGTYKESNESTFPTNMMFNSEKSGCIDKEGQRIENSLTYSNGVVYVETNSTLYCYVYFDRNDVVSISVTTPPNKTEYEPGENFDSTGMVVTATYIDGTAKEVTNYTISNGSNLQDNPTSITISYIEEGLMVATIYDVTVKPKTAIINFTWDIDDEESQVTIYATFAPIPTIPDYTVTNPTYDNDGPSQIELPIGTIMEFKIKGEYNSYIKLNGTTVVDTSGTYTYTVTKNASIDMYGNKDTGRKRAQIKIIESQ
ncbi:MAG: bacterial Ig-like domain-containing protein, partial [Clostridia bacterium]|nr:bacterial Ig-like domain-containing protein [Clostridia bacterium]